MAFDGAVMLLAVDRGMDAHLGLTYVPAVSDDVDQAEDGDIRIGISRRGERPMGAPGRWWLIFRGDAQLDDLRVVDNQGEVQQDGLPFTVFEFGGVTAQLLAVSLTPNQSVVGKPKKSPMRPTTDGARITLPIVATAQPEEQPERQGGVVYADSVWLSLLMANRDPSVGQGWSSWNVLRSITYTVSSGMRETDRLSATRAIPELDKTMWGDLVTWTSDGYPIEASASFVDSGVTGWRELRLAIAFLFYGISLTMLTEALVLKRGTIDDFVHKQSLAKVLDADASSGSMGGAANISINVDPGTGANGQTGSEGNEDLGQPSNVDLDRNQRRVKPSAMTDRRRQRRRR